jgi:hypothetical protein
LIPPSSSSIYKTFIADLTAQNGGVAPTLAASVKTVEQNDPTAVTGASNPADAIVPFSSARLHLYNTGYFKNPTTGTTLSAGVSLLTGTTPDSASAYTSSVLHYVIFRQSDTDPTKGPGPMEPGSSLTWIQTLFSNPGGTPPFFARNAGQALIAAAGTTPDYHDIGDPQ